MTTPLVMYRGDDRDFLLTLTEGDGPLDLTGYSALFTARTDTTAEAYAFQLTTADDSIEIDADPTTGGLTLHVPASATSGQSGTVTYVCDLELTDGDGNVRTIPDPVWGPSNLIRLRVRADVTHE